MGEDFVESVLGLLRGYVGDYGFGCMLVYGGVRNGGVSEGVEIFV